MRYKQVRRDQVDRENVDGTLALQQSEWSGQARRHGALEVSSVSRSHHHSQTWGTRSRGVRARNRHPRIFWAGSRRVGEAPAWHLRLCDIRPARRADRVLERAVLSGLDPDAVVWSQSPNRAPHTYYW